jgi:hypothetical protein
VSVDPRADLEREHHVLRRDAQRVVARWRGFLASENASVGQLLDERDVDLAGLEEAVKLLAASLENAPSRRGR